MIPILSALVGFTIGIVSGALIARTNYRQAIREIRAEQPARPFLGRPSPTHIPGSGERVDSGRLRDSGGILHGGENPSPPPPQSNAPRPPRRAHTRAECRHPFGCTICIPPPPGTKLPDRFA